MANTAKGQHLQTAGVIGAGAWGTALAQSLRRARRDVVVWARDPATVEDIRQHHRNEKRLPGIKLDTAIRATESIAEAAAADVLLLAVPTQHVRAVATLLSPHFDRATPLIVTAKGFEQGSHAFLSEICEQVLGVRPAILSGPSFASDVAHGLPTAVTLAASKLELAERLAAALGHKRLRIYSSEDLLGVQLGGAVKNVLAIAAGILRGRHLGASAHAALVTRAFRELSRFGLSAGARPETLAGLSCLGDLILTCNSPQSRNFTFGRHLGEGLTVAQALKATGGTVEGMFTSNVVAAMAATVRPPVDLPIVMAVDRILSEKCSVDDAIDDLLSRPQKSEA